MHGIGLGFERAHALAAQFGVVEIAEAVREFLVEGARFRGLAIFFGEAGAPVECGRDFAGGGIQRDLLFEILLRILGCAAGAG